MQKETQIIIFFNGRMDFGEEERIKGKKNLQMIIWLILVLRRDCLSVPLYGYYFFIVRHVFFSKSIMSYVCAIKENMVCIICKYMNIQFHNREWFQMILQSHVLTKSPRCKLTVHSISHFSWDMKILTDSAHKGTVKT